MEYDGEPDSADWIACKCGHDMYVHARPGYGGCMYGEGCKCAGFEIATPTPTPT